MKTKHQPDPQHLAWTREVIRRAKALGIYPPKETPRTKTR